MLHWYLREGLADERIERLMGQPGPVLRFAGRFLVAAGERLGAEPSPRAHRGTASFEWSRV